MATQGPQLETGAVQGPQPPPLEPIQPTGDSTQVPLATPDGQILDQTTAVPTAGFDKIGASIVGPVPTVITSEPARDAIKQDQETLQQASATLEPQPTQQTQTQQPLPKPDAIDQRIQQETQDPVLSDLQNRIDAEQAQIDAELSTQVGMLDSMAKRFDASTAAKVDAIKASFNNRRAQMQQINKARLEGQRILGFRSGRARFAGEIQSGILAAEERAGIARLAELDAQELQLIAEAQEANDEKQYTLMRDKVQLMKDTRREKFQVAADLQNLAIQQEQLLMDKARAEREEMQFEIEQQDRQIESLAFQLIGRTDAEIQQVADEFGLPAGRLLGMTKELRREDRMAELGITSAELGIEGQRLSNQQLRTKISLLDQELSEKLGTPEGDIKRIDALKDKLSIFQSIGQNKSGFKVAVGPNPFARKFSNRAVFDFFTGDSQEFLGDVAQLLSQETLDQLISVKADGATFGNLSDGERAEVRNASTALGNMARFDEDGRLIKFVGSEDAVADKLNTLYSITQRALENEGAFSNISSEESQSYDNI